jgi:hypothetical protein
LFCYLFNFVYILFFCLLKFRFHLLHQYEFCGFCRFVFYCIATVGCALFALPVLDP